MSAREAAVSDIRRDTNAERMRIKLALADTITLDPSLTKLEMRIALRLLSGYLNFRTLRMWPGAERLAAELAADLRNVRRALKRLCRAKGNGEDEGGYFEKVKGTGRGPGNPTAYEARWDRAFEGSRVAKERLVAAKKRVKTDTEEGQNARLKAGNLAHRSLRGENSETSCLLDTLGRGIGGSGGEGGAIAPLDGDPAGDADTTTDARQGDQAASQAPPQPRPRRASDGSKPKTWRGAKRRPLGPAERAAHAERTRRKEESS